MISLNQMREQMRVDCCEWAGWKPVNGTARGNPDKKTYGYLSELPPIHESLDAVALIEAKLSDTEFFVYFNWLDEIGVKGIRDKVSATATQRLEALHRTLFSEKWMEK